MLFHSVQLQDHGLRTERRRNRAISNLLRQTGGYIVDVANVTFRRSDGKRARLKNATQTGFTINGEKIDINNGWARLPQASIDTTQTIEITYATNKTDLEFFALLNNSEVLFDQTRTLSTSEDFDVPAAVGGETTVEIELPAGALNPYIEGLTMGTGSTPAAGAFLFTAGSDSARPKVVLLAADVTGLSSITIYYDEVLDGATTVAVRDNVASASGSAELRYRVYGAGENASVIGYLIIQIYKAKVTGKPGFDNSYGQSGTHSVTFTSLDAGRQDHNMYEMIFQPII